MEIRLTANRLNKISNILKEDIGTEQKIQRATEEGFFIKLIAFFFSRIRDEIKDKHEKIKKLVQNIDSATSLIKDHSCRLNFSKSWGLFGNREIDEIERLRTLDEIHETLRCCNENELCTLGKLKFCFKIDKEKNIFLEVLDTELEYVTTSLKIIKCQDDEFLDHLEHLEKYSSISSLIEYSRDNNLKSTSTQGGLGELINFGNSVSDFERAGFFINGQFNFELAEKTLKLSVDQEIHTIENVPGYPRKLTQEEKQLIMQSRLDWLNNVTAKIEGKKYTNLDYYMETRNEFLSSLGLDKKTPILINGKFNRVVGKKLYQLQQEKTLINRAKKTRFMD